jgi:RNA-directed DNA polymerase
MTSLSHLFNSWDHFKRGKHKRKDIQDFERHLEDQIFILRDDLATLQYRHDRYDQFYVNDPKQRLISKATVKDRLVHQAVYSAMLEVFDKKFIFHSLSSRIGKGTHKGVTYLQGMIKKVSANGTRHCYSLKMDIKRFFDSIDHRLLKKLIRKDIQDERALKLIDIIIHNINHSI